MTTKQKGELAALKVRLRALEKGFILSKPEVDCRYDFILDDGQSLLRTQVKFANGGASGCVTIRTATSYIKRKGYSTLPYSANEIDVLLVYIAKIDKILYFPSSILDGKRGQFSLRLTEPKQYRSNSIMAREFIW